MSDELPRLKSGVRAAAIMRSMELAGIAVYLRRRGDADAGSIYVKLVLSASEVIIYAQERGGGGSLVWQPVKAAGMTEGEAEDWLGKCVDRDPDLWIIELEDLRGIFTLDALG